MRIFGRELSWRSPVVVRAAALSLPPSPGAGSTENGASALVQPLPPFGTNPPSTPVRTASRDMGARLVSNDPRDLWYLALPSKLSPRQVVTILRSGLGGDVWQSWQLLSLMLDSWPMLRKCAHELRAAAAAVKYGFKPHCLPGQEPTDSAKERADLVQRAAASFRTDPFMADEESWFGTVYDATDALLAGVSLQEVMWMENAQGELMPRATAWVHPRHYTFGNDGRLAIFDDNYNRLSWSLAQNPGVAPDPNKFLFGKYKSKSGSPLGAGLMRPLAYYWSAMVFNREWMLSSAQRYGAPFLDATYKPGTPDAEISKLTEFLDEAAQNGYLVHVEGTTVNVEPAQSLGADNRQAHIVQEANEACQILLLGQTATTSPTPGKLGNESAHENVKRENVEALAAWAASDALQQFARAVVRVNYGDEEEVPTCEPDFTAAPDPMAEAERDQIFLQARVPMDAEDFYRKHNLRMPETGDLVVVGGQLGYMAEPEDGVGGAPEPPPGFGGDPEGAEDPEAEGDGEGFTKASLAASLAKASPAELRELRERAGAVVLARHANGERGALGGALRRLRRRTTKDKRA